MDHSVDDRKKRALQSLEGLSIGDALGELFFRFEPLDYIPQKKIPPVSIAPYSDDTEMALSIVEVLLDHGEIDQDILAKSFTARFVENPSRGYGGGAIRLLQDISSGGDWRELSAAMFNGKGSMGNGSAMRVAPLGAYYADDLELLKINAEKSARVTHNNSEGVAGAIAIALAAAWACHYQTDSTHGDGMTLLEFVLAHTPKSQTRDNIQKAINIGVGVSVFLATGKLGNGSQILVTDTVPYSLWCAARHLDDYKSAFWTTVSGFGDMDTNCAIVGGIVACSAPQTIPEKWNSIRESLKFSKT